MTNLNQRIESMSEVRKAIKAIIKYHNLRGKFSSVHPDLAAEGITRVEVGEEGFYFFNNTQPGVITLSDSSGWI